MFNRLPINHHLLVNPSQSTISSCDVLPPCGSKNPFVLAELRRTFHISITWPGPPPSADVLLQGQEEPWRRKTIKLFISVPSPSVSVSVCGFVCGCQQKELWDLISSRFSIVRVRHLEKSESPLFTLEKTHSPQLETFITPLEVNEFPSKTALTTIFSLVFSARGKAFLAPSRDLLQGQCVNPARTPGATLPGVNN